MSKETLQTIKDGVQTVDQLIRALENLTEGLDHSSYINVTIRESGRVVTTSSAVVFDEVRLVEETLSDGSKVRDIELELSL